MSAEKTARTDPSPWIRASKTSPGATGTIGPSAPKSTISPARSGRPGEAIVRANQTTAPIGLPRQERPVPVDTERPPRSRFMPQSRTSIPARRLTWWPITNRPGDDVLGCAKNVGGCRRRLIEVSAEYEAYLGLDPRLKHALQIDLLP